MRVQLHVLYIFFIIFVAAFDLRDTECVCLRKS